MSTGTDGHRNLFLDDESLLWDRKDACRVRTEAP
jgi:hypothetical protein